MKRKSFLKLTCTLGLVLALLAGLIKPALAETPPPADGEGSPATVTTADEQPRPPENAPDEVTVSGEGSYATNEQLTDAQGDPVESAQQLAIQAQMVDYVTGCPTGVLPIWLGGTGSYCTSGNYNLIQEAINDGKVISGWTVYAPKNTYTAGFDIHKSITVAGERPYDTIVQDNVTISSANVTLRNFSILGGNVRSEGNSGTIRLSDLLIDPQGAAFIGVEVTNHNGSVSLYNVSAVGGSKGAVIDVTAGAGTVTIINSIFSRNYDDNTALDPASLEIYANNAVKLDNVVVSNNSINNGAYIEFARSLTIKNSIFDSNGLANDPLINLAGIGLQAFDMGLTPGTVSLSNVSASNNLLSGAWIMDSGAVTVENGTFRGNLNDAGLFILNYGTITLNRVDASENGLESGSGDGVSLSGMKTAGTKITNSQFNDNAAGGLFASVMGTLTLKNVSANRNQTGSGIFVENQSALSAQTVNLAILNASDNASAGIEVISRGAVALNGLTANGNGMSGLSVDNCMLDFDTNRCTYTAGVSLSSTLGANQLNGNVETGLVIFSAGSISLNGLSANRNLLDGALIDNVSGAGNVSISNAAFDDNGQRGVAIDSRGLVTLARVSANSNDLSGAAIGDLTSAGQPRTVSISASSFDGNAGGGSSDGLRVYATSTITLNHVSASGNSGGTGAWLESSGGGVSLSSSLGANIFSNNGDTGIHASGRGSLNLKDTTASNNGGRGVELDNSGAAGTVTISNLRAESNNNDGLTIDSWGNISLSRVVSSGSASGNGALISNPGNPLAAPVVSISHAEFNQNFAGGLVVASKGTITLNHVSASESLSGSGAALDNCQLDGGLTCAGSGNVYIYNSLGMNSFNANHGNGLTIETRGGVTLNGVSAIENTTGGYGARIINNHALNAVTITSSKFNHNDLYGLSVDSKGTLVLRNISASRNAGGSGAILDNSAISGSVRTISVSASVFSDNSGDGLAAYSKGSITLNGINASGNSGRGADLDACQSGGTACTGSGSITLYNTLGENHFDNNQDYGFYALARGSITLYSLTASGSLLDGSPTGGALLDNAEGVGDVKVQNARFSGTDTIGLVINSSGAISLNKVNASDNLLSGAVLGNLSAATSKSVSITASSFDRNTGDGLVVSAHGNLTLNNVSASGNGGMGANLDTCLIDSTCTSAGTLSILSTLGGNQFSNNGKNGLLIQANNTVTISKASLYGNGMASPDPGYSGLKIDQYAASAVTISCSTFSGSGDYGISATLNTGNLFLKSVLVGGNNRFPPAGTDLGVFITNGTVFWSKTTCY